MPNGTHFPNGTLVLNFVPEKHCQLTHSKQKAIFFQLGLRDKGKNPQLWGSLKDVCWRQIVLKECWESYSGLVIVFVWMIIIAILTYALYLGERSVNPVKFSTFQDSLWCICITAATGNEKFVCFNQLLNWPTLQLGMVTPFLFQILVVLRRWYVRFDIGSGRKQTVDGFNVRYHSLPLGLEFLLERDWQQLSSNCSLFQWQRK